MTVTKLRMTALAPTTKRGFVVGIPGFRPFRKLVSAESEIAPIYIRTALFK
jgi:hypothetical protein